MSLFRWDEKSVTEGISKVIDSEEEFTRTLKDNEKERIRPKRMTFAAD